MNENTKQSLEKRLSGLTAKLENITELVQSSLALTRQAYGIIAELETEIEGIYIDLGDTNSTVL